MAKVKSVYVCNECGYESGGWLGRCPACNAWNSFFEQKIDKTADSNPNKARVKSAHAFVEKSNSRLESAKATQSVKLSKVETSERSRLGSGISELDRVLGGGIVRGSLVLIGGDPGIGKSTLIMQVAGNCAKQNKVLYVTGEESAQQIKGRAERLGLFEESDLDDLMLLAETDFEIVCNEMERIRPDVVVIDSIQTMFSGMLDSAPGSVGQVREVTTQLMRIAKIAGITVFIVGHVTKEGSIAGPRVLEHMVDTVLYFEGERHMSYRVLRSVKNRFGSTNEIGIFDMTSKGLRQVDNPSELFLNDRATATEGTAVVSTMEGSRSILVEVQALVVKTAYGNPRRTARGIDYNRLNMIIAVLEKKHGVPLGNCDVYVNVTGGLVLDEPACDLGIAMAILSSFDNSVIPCNKVYLGEIGLTGEVRAITHIEKRIAEAERMGFEMCIIPEGNKKGVHNDINKVGNKVTTVKTIKDAWNTI